MTTNQPTVAQPRMPQAGVVTAAQAIAMGAGMEAARKAVNQKPVSPVLITRIRAVGADGQTVELQLEQLFEPPVGTNPVNSILALTMEGHTGFNSQPRRRLCWQNFSTKKVVQMGLIRSIEELEAQPQRMILLDGDKAIPLRLVGPAGEVIETKIIEINSLVPREWKDRNTGQQMKQRPKQAGADGDVLTYKGAPIYQNPALVIPGPVDPATGRKWDEDLVIQHDNTILGSRVRSALAASGNAIGQPNIPDGTRAINTDTNSSTYVDPALQAEQAAQTANKQ